MNNKKYLLSRTIINGGKNLEEEQKKIEIYDEIRNLIIENGFVFTPKSCQEITDLVYKGDLNLNVIKLFFSFVYVVRRILFVFAWIFILIAILGTVAFLCGNFIKLVLFFAQ